LLFQVEIGAGFNTPGVIRGRLEQVTYHTHANLVRINRDYPQVSKEIKTKSAELGMSAGEALDGLKSKINN
jgi:hypothetical protein